MELRKQADILGRSGKRYEHLSARYDFIGRGITGEFNFLDINGERVLHSGGKGDKATWGANETELCNTLEVAGWQLVSHAVQDMPEGQRITFHYLKFVREIV